MDENGFAFFMLGVIIGAVIILGVFIIDQTDSVRVDGYKTLEGLSDCDIAEIREYLVEKYPCNCVTTHTPPICPTQRCCPEQCSNSCEK